MLFVIISCISTVACAVDPFCPPDGAAMPYHPDKGHVQCPNIPSWWQLKEGIDPEITDADSIEVQAIKIAVSKVYGNVSEYYGPKRTYEFGYQSTLESQLKQLQFTLSNKHEQEVLDAAGWGFNYVVLQEYRRLKSLQRMGVQSHTFSGTIKLFHAFGTHQCWSRDVIGYSCRVDGNNFMDCNQALNQLSRQNCCNWGHPDGNSIGFQMGSCSAFM